MIEKKVNRANEGMASTIAAHAHTAPLRLPRDERMRTSDRIPSTRAVIGGPQIESNLSSGPRDDRYTGFAAKPGKYGAKARSDIAKAITASRHMRFSCIISVANASFSGEFSRTFERPVDEGPPRAARPLQAHVGRHFVPCDALVMASSLAFWCPDRLATNSARCVSDMFLVSALTARAWIS